MAEANSTAVGTFGRTLTGEITVHAPTKRNQAEWTWISATRCPSVRMSLEGPAKKEIPHCASGSFPFPTGTIIFPLEKFLQYSGCVDTMPTHPYNRSGA